MDIGPAGTFVGVLPVASWAVCRQRVAQYAAGRYGLIDVPKNVPAELDRLIRQMPVRDAEVRCCIKCNERRPDNSQEECSHLAAPLLSW
jgi:hypothetical protein